MSTTKKYEQKVFVRGHKKIMKGYSRPMKRPNVLSTFKKVRGSLASLRNLLIEAFVVCLILSAIQYSLGAVETSETTVTFGFLMAIIGVILHHFSLFSNSEKNRLRCSGGMLTDASKGASSYRGILFRRYHWVTGVFILAGASLVVLKWFSGPYILTNADFSWFPNMQKAFYSTLYTWDSANRPDGVSGIRNLPTGIPVMVYGSIMQAIGVSPVVSFQTWFYLTFLGAGLSMYAFCLLVMPPRYKTLSAGVAALIYIFNPYVMITPTIFAQYVWVTFYPLRLALFVKGVREGRGLIYACLANLVILVTSVENMAQPAFLLLDWFTYLLYFVFYAIYHRKEFNYASFRFVLSFLLTFLLLNLFWFLPELVYAPQVIRISLTTYSNEGYAPFAIIESNSAHPLSAILRLLGYPYTLAGAGGVPYYSWGNTFYTPFFVWLGYLLPIMSFLAVLEIRDGIGVEGSFILMLTCIGIILMNGLAPPFEPINALIYQIPLLSTIIKLPYFYYGVFVVFGYAYLIGLGTTHLYLTIKRSAVRIGSALYASGLKIFTWSKRSQLNLSKLVATMVVALFVFSVVGVYSYPMWTGDVIRQSNPGIGGLRYEIPTYYYEASSWLDGQGGNFGVMAVPLAEGTTVSFYWLGSYWSGPDPTAQMLRKFSGITPSTNLFRYAFSGNISHPGKILALVNAKYVLIQDDTNWNFVNIPSAFFIPCWQINVTRFDGGYIYLGSNKLFSEVGKGLTVSAWLRSFSDTSSNIVTKWYSGSIGSYILAQVVNHEQSQILFAINTESSQVELKAPININDWYYVVGTYDGSSVKLYVNGHLVNSTSMYGYIQNNELPLVLGKNSREDSKYYYGLLSNVQIYNRSLGSQEIELLYSKGFRAGPVNSSGLIGWWPLSTITSGRTRDASGHNNDGIVSKGVYTQSYLSGYSNMSKGLEKCISMYDDFVPVATFGKLVFFENKFWQPLQIYATYNVLPVNNVNQMLTYADNSLDFLNYVYTTNITFPHSRGYMQERPVFSYKQISPAEYLVHISSASPVYLVLSQSFDKDWSAFVNGSALPQRFHFVANGYANGWYIPYAGNLSIRLYYEPQSLVYFSAQAGVGLTIIMLVYKLPRRTLFSVRQNIHQHFHGRAIRRAKAPSDKN